MATHHTSVRLPPSIRRWLEDASRRQNKSITDVVIEAITTYQINQLRKDPIDVRPNS
jgi:PIN domain nuclease of toxin-antitoxin system